MRIEDNEQYFNCCIVIFVAEIQYIMRLRFFALGLVLFLSPFLLAQQGMWTWMHGSPTLNLAGNYGIQGTAAANNDPPALYEACEWTDLSGNFWLFGGVDGNYNLQNTLWKFDPLLNMWTWMNGSSTARNSPGIYGVQGMPASGNIPGARGWGANTWTDAGGDLWLFGGIGYDVSGVNGMLGDLWKYNIASNTWTWMSGSPVYYYAGVYGTLNKPSVSNSPPSRRESNASWTDAGGDLWLFGGQSFAGGTLNDLWKYTVSTNQWTWMHGSNSQNSSGNYGTKGIASSTNDPPARWAYSKFKDVSGNLWLFAGSDGFNAYNDLWKYNPFTNQWTWMSGSNQLGDMGSPGTTCIPAASNNPISRLENRACWTDACGNFYAFGGMENCGWNSTFNDLWHFNVNTNDWALVNGTNQINLPGNWGKMNVPSSSNIPDGRCGSSPFKDNQGNLWLFGGAITGLIDKHNDLWRFVPDTSCVSGSDCQVALETNFTASAQAGCAPLQVFFTNASRGASAYTWQFGDGFSSNTSNAVHMYNSPGTYTVSLTISNGSSSDSLVRQSFISVDSCIVWNCGKMFVPNFFSPNNDGVNDELCVYGQCIESLSFSIFDRWGEKVFETNAQGDCWDGNFRGLPMNNAIFVYYLKATLVTGEIVRQKGTISLAR